LIVLQTSEEQQGCGMQSELNNHDCDDMAGIWRNAQLRRNEDLGTWLRYFFKQPEQPTSIDPESRLRRQRNATTLTSETS
jgi:hypothetical protein